MGASLVTAPTTEPVRLDELQLHLRTDGADADAAVVRYLAAARQYVENQLRRALITQTWDFTFDGDWPTVIYQRIDLPLQPVQSVTSITYVDTNGATQTLATNQYALRQSGGDNLAYIEPAYGVTWPSVRDQSAAITVRCVVGYGTAGSVPECIKTAIMLQVELLYDRNSNARDLLEMARDSLLSAYRVVRL